jgi:hypothetical protein
MVANSRLLAPEPSGRLSDRPVVFALASKMTEPQLNWTRDLADLVAVKSAFSMGGGSAIEEHTRIVMGFADSRAVGASMGDHSQRGTSVRRKGRRCSAALVGSGGKNTGEKAIRG